MWVIEAQVIGYLTNGVGFTEKKRLRLVYNELIDVVFGRHTHFFLQQIAHIVGRKVNCFSKSIQLMELPALQTFLLYNRP